MSGNVYVGVQMMNSVLDFTDSWTSLWDCFLLLALPVGSSKHIFILILIYFQCREVINSTTKEGEVNARLKQLEVALDAAEIGKQNAETEAALAKEKVEALKSEIKQVELMVSVHWAVDIALL